MRFKLLSTHKVFSKSIEGLSTLKTLSEEVRHIVVSPDVTDTQGVILDVITDAKPANFQMFAALRGLRVVSSEDG